MALNLDAIKKRLNELNGGGKSKINLWKPTVGEYRIRAVPWNDTTDEIPFHERKICYIGKNRGFIDPACYGKPNPLNELLRKLYSSGSPEDRAMAKKLQPSMKAYMAILARAEEDKGVQVWSFNRNIYTRLLGFFSEEGVDNYMDPFEGIDLIVKIVKSPKKFNDRDVFDTTIDLARKGTPLSNDAEKIKKLLESVPTLGDIDDMYTQCSEREIKQMIDAWLSGDDEQSKDEGTGRGGAQASKDDLDKLADDVKPQTRKPQAPVTAAPKAQRPARKAADVDVDDELAAPAKKQSLDEVFDDLMTDD